jgi:hypothetical protein
MKTGQKASYEEMSKATSPCDHQRRLPQVEQLVNAIIHAQEEMRYFIIQVYNIIDCENRNVIILEDD